MKIRSDFVTNSSSTSFICSMCGRTSAGSDCSVSAIHCYGCGSEFGSYDTAECGCFDKFVDMMSEKDKEEYDEYGELTSCPICHPEKFDGKRTLIDDHNSMVTYFLSAKDPICDDFKALAVHFNKMIMDLTDEQYTEFVKKFHSDYVRVRTVE